MGHERTLTSFGKQVRIRLLELDMQEKIMRTGTEMAGIAPSQTLLFTDIGRTGASIDRPGMNKLRASRYMTSAPASRRIWSGCSRSASKESKKDFG